jgi:outer membrane lipoprotein-sorting protein
MSAKEPTISPSGRSFACSESKQIPLAGTQRIQQPNRHIGASHHSSELDLNTLEAFPVITKTDPASCNNFFRSTPRRSSDVTPGRLLLSGALVALLCGALVIPPIARADQRDRLLSLLTRIESTYARINDYTAVFGKQERVDGKLLPEETIVLKFQKPLKVYMKWIGDPFKGTEALYVDGSNGNKLLVHRGGLLGILTLSLDPRGSLAMKGNRHPITEVGFGFLIDGLQRNVRTALRQGELEVIRVAEETFHGRTATVVEAKFTPRAGRTYYASRMVCHFDTELMLPIGASFYDERDVLFERYAYSDVKLNVGLTPLDFSRENKAYRF